MYWNGNDYDKMAMLAIDIYTDYHITTFPVDEKNVCKQLGLKLVPYSAYPEEGQLLLRKKSKDAFLLPATCNTPPAVFYNDSIASSGRIRYSIFHEVKHYVNNDSDESIYNEDMAEYFSKYFMAPIPYLIKKGVNDPVTIVSDHDMSYEAAQHTLQNLRNRRRVYGDKIFDYEKPLIDLLCPEI